MEQVVWMWVGAISILIMFGSLGTLYMNANDDQLFVLSEQAADQLGEMCNRMCRLPSESYLPVTVNLPSGVVINASQDSLCTTFKEQNTCTLCGCTYNDFALNLDTPEAKKLFRTHEYQCFFLNEERIITIECRG